MEPECTHWGRNDRLSLVCGWNSKGLVEAKRREQLTQATEVSVAFLVPGLESGTLIRLIPVTSPNLIPRPDEVQQHSTDTQGQRVLCRPDRRRRARRRSSRSSDELSGRFQ